MKINTNMDWRVFLAVLMFVAAGTHTVVNSYAKKPDGPPGQLKIGESHRVEKNKDEPVLTQEQEENQDDLEGEQVQE